MSSSSKAEKDRLYHLDLIRFIAALYVVFYHFGFRGYAKDNFSILQFPPIESFSKYGYLGVDLFFIISGFVILMSVKNSNLIDFIISRVTRLYPAFWFCVLLSAMIMTFYGGDLFVVELDQVLFNLTMLNGFFGVEHVDGVYWSLVVELKFYILIGIILLIKQLKHIKIFGYTLLSIAALQIFLPFSEAPLYLRIIYYITFAKWSAYFVAGMFFYLIKSNRTILTNMIPIIVAYAIAVYNAIEKANLRNDLYGYNFNVAVVISLITVFFAIIFLISINQLKGLNKRVFLSFGILTYPLYLIHQNIGYIIFNQLGNTVNKWVLLVSVIILMLITSFLISKKIEKPLGSYMRNKLRENKILIRLKAKL